MKIDKENDGVAFNDSAHVYWDISNPKKEYISVTTLIGSYAQPFDSDFWSKYKALEKILDTDVWKDLKKTLLNTHRITKEILEAYSVDINDLNKEQQNILDAWDKKKIESCERGTKIHSQLEHSFYNMKDDKPLQKFGLGGKFICKEGYTKLDLENGVYPEYLISWSTPDNILNLAGQIDLMVKYGNDIVIIDHKTNEKIDLKGGFNTVTRGTAKMQYPLNTIEDCNYGHYELQLSTYAFMLQQRHPEYVIKDLILNHYDHNMKNTLYHCIYRKDEEKRMLADYYKNKKQQLKAARRKPIVY